MGRGKGKSRAESSKDSHEVAKKPGQGVRLVSQTKQIVENVRIFFEKEKQYGMNIKRSNVIARTAEATQVSTMTVKRIHKEYISRESQLLTPVKRYAASRIRVNPDSFDCATIRREIRKFYEKKEYPTLSLLLEKLKEVCAFPGGRFCLWRLLQDLGYAYKKRDKRQYIYEQPNVLEQRHTYLRAIRKMRRNNDQDIIYTDETWVNSHHTNDYIWLDKDGKGGWKVPSGKGTRLIVLHAGGVEGWVEGADLVFKSKTNSADYHDEMNSEHYIEWLTEQLLPRLERPTVIVLDNASYHNKQIDKPPTSSNRKDEIKKWLDEHNIHYSPTDIKKTLLELVKQHRSKPLYLTDKHIHEMGHAVLRLPVAHCELNPIELAWASVKGYVAKHNKDFTMKEIQRLTPEGFEHTTTEMWRQFCRHVVDVENEYVAKDCIIEDAVEEMVIEIGEDDSDEDDDNEEDMMDDDDRQVIGMVLLTCNEHEGDEEDGCMEGQSTQTTDVCTNPRRDLTEVFDKYDPQFLHDVLPLS